MTGSQIRKERHRVFATITIEQFEIAVYRKSPRELEVGCDASLTKHLESLEPQYPIIEIDNPKYQGLRFIRDQFWEK